MEANEKEREFREKTLETFLKDGRLAAIPARRKKKLVILEELARAFEPGRVYPEKEVNAVLLRYHEDFCTLRRELVDEGLLERDHGLYRRKIEE